MRYQRATWDCGPAAVVNAAAALGATLDHWRVVEASGARATGASEVGLLQALRDAGLSARAYESNDRNEAWSWLRGELSGGRAVILCADNWTHWVCCCGLLGAERVVLIDSNRSKRNKGENGVHVLPHTALMRRWWNARRWADGERRLYAICVNK